MKTARVPFLRLGATLAGCLLVPIHATALDLPRELAALTQNETNWVCASTMLGLAKAAVEDMPASELWERSSEHYLMTRGVIVAAASLTSSSGPITGAEQERLAGITLDALMTPKQAVVEYCTDISIATYAALNAEQRELVKGQAFAAFDKLVSE